ncbi:MAG: metallophosphoesterase [Marinilabiliaceae bacterium]|jgi:predicted MPP superfamily phosphohydrolase|nr:metallophosphoesterase [Marinilabiliaceae bacterium]
MHKKKNIKRFILWGFLAGITLLFLYGNIIGRNNFRFDEVVVEIDDLPPALDGFRITHLSDLHLASFRKREDKLRMIYDSISKLECDLIINTGDFVSYNYHEMERFTGILALPRARYGKFAVPGNHDTGYYDKDFRTRQDRHLEEIRARAEAAGYIWLSDSTAKLIIDSSCVSISGVSISGRIPFIKYGSIEEAMRGAGSADFKIVLSHDPKHWTDELQYLDIDLTLSGHTHGMQLGLLLPWLKISPASLLFRHWYGLYNNGKSYLYVNRGIGTMGPPIRIGMPPEITLITLSRSD